MRPLKLLKPLTEYLLEITSIANSHSYILGKVLDLPDLNDAERNRGTVALSKLCSRYGALPESCKLTDHLEKTSELAHASGGLADVYRGRYGNRTVAIKALRMCETDDHKKMQTVRIDGILHLRLHNNIQLL